MNRRILGSMVGVFFRQSKIQNRKWPGLFAIVHLKVDIIVAARRAQAGPGGNVTGITNLTGELGGKRLELLKEAVPKVARVAVLYDPANPSSVLSAERRPSTCGARAAVDYSTLGGTGCRRLREGPSFPSVPTSRDALETPFAGGSPQIGLEIAGHRCRQRRRW